jgi:hypothetical protein
MNKLASISFLHRLGLPTIFPQIINSTEEAGVRKRVNSFYSGSVPGWVLRCARPPSKYEKVERGLPWDIANGEEDLIHKILFLQKEIGSGYLVFCHPVKEMVRGGIMLVEGGRVVVESAIGNPRQLSAFYRGYRSPEQTIIFNPGMMSSQRYGNDVLHVSDLSELRGMERSLDWSDIGAISDPVSVEFSWLNDRSFYVHDLSIN